MFENAADVGQFRASERVRLHVVWKLDLRERGAVRVGHYQCPDIASGDASGTLYEQEGLRQLTNPKYYREIPESVCTDTVEKINQILTHLNNIGFISDDQYIYLLALVPAEPRSFYLLPKVHKDKAKWPNPRMPEGRPIVADCGSETERICKFIDFFLKPLSNHHPSYIKDTYHFVAKIRGQRIPDSAFFGNRRCNGALY